MTTATKEAPKHEADEAPAREIMILEHNDTNQTRIYLQERGNHTNVVIHDYWLPEPLGKWVPTKRRITVQHHELRDLLHGLADCCDILDGELLPPDKPAVKFSEAPEAVRKNYAVPEAKPLDVEHGTGAAVMTGAEAISQMKAQGIKYSAAADLARMGSIGASGIGGGTNRSQVSRKSKVASGNLRSGKYK